jgi:hypothetical protein
MPQSSVRPQHRPVRRVGGRSLGLFLSICLTTFLAGPLPAAIAQTTALSAPDNSLGSEMFRSDLFTGAAVFSIPIQIPDGINGVTPSLALTYNSNAPNGWVGVGWRLEAGAIVKPPRRPNKRLLSLGGTSTGELVPVSVDPSGVGEYRTKTESFLKITYNGIFWTVTDKAGRRHHFGATPASRMGSDPSTEAETVQWLLDRVIDPSGNEALYRYVRDRGQLYLDGIDYTANSANGLSPRRAVKFHLEPRPDIEHGFGGPFNPIVAKRLKTIEVVADTASGQHAGAWAMTYGASMISSRSLLTALTRYGSDVVLDTNGTVMAGSALPSTSFAYDDTPAPGFVTTQWPLSYEPTMVALADQQEVVVTGDFNGDGKTDIARTRSGWDSWRVFISNGTGFSVQAWSVAPEQALVNYGDGHEVVLVGDFNGDGKTDIARTRSGEDSWRVFLSTGAGFSDQPWLFLPTGSGFAAQAWSVAPEPSVVNYADRHEVVFAGDFNGDGKTDIARTRSGWDSWRVFISNGTGFSVQAWSVAPEQALANYGDGHEVVLVRDFNGDGKTDIARTRSGWDSWRVFLSTGSGFSDQQWQFLPTGSGFLPKAWSVAPEMSVNNYADRDEVALVGDFKGNGTAGIAKARSGWGAWRVSQPPTRSAPPDGLITIAGALGGSATWSYTPSTLHSTTSIPIIAWTVTQTTINDGVGGSATTNYAYSGGAWATDDVGEFRGFAQVTVTDPSGVRTTTLFHQDDVKKGRVASQRIEDAGGHLFTLVEHTYTDVRPFPGVFWPRLDRTDNFHYDGGIAPRQTATSFEYDAYGNPTRTYQWGDVALTGDEFDEYTEWLMDTTNWLHRPSRVALYSPYAPYMTLEPLETRVPLRERWISYDGLAWATLGTRGLPTREESRLAGARGAVGNPVVTRAYNAYGKPLTTTDALGCTTSTSYDSTQLTLVQIRA